MNYPISLETLLFIGPEKDKLEREYQAYIKKQTKDIRKIASRRTWYDMHIFLVHYVKGDFVIFEDLPELIKRELQNGEDVE